MNIAQPWSVDGRFDLIFIRNVLIYFSDEARHTVFDYAHRALQPTGFLALGPAETTWCCEPGFELRKMERSSFLVPSSAEVRAKQAKIQSPVAVP